MYTEYRQAFAVFDKDGDGTISTEELDVVMRSLGENPSEEELEDLIQEIDVDGKCMWYQGENPSEEELEDLIQETDVDSKYVWSLDGDGTISTEELDVVMRSLGENP